MKLDVCCGRHKVPGYIGVDIQQFDGVDIIADLNSGWPFDNNSIDEVYCKDGIEHLKKPIHTMNEIHRVLKPGGKAVLIVPSTTGLGAFQDPTHVSYWNLNSFPYYEKGHSWRDQYPNMISAEFIAESIIEVGKEGIYWVHANLRKPNGE